MTDQDLIAEGREVLTACAILRADDELTRWAKNHLPAVLVDLERARRRIAELESISEKRRIRMVDAEEDIAEVRGIPDEVEIGGSVVPAVEWLLAQVAELEAWKKRMVDQARRAIGDLDRWHRLYEPTADNPTPDLAGLIDRALDERDAARARVAELEAKS